MKGSFTVPDMSEQGLLQVKLVLQTYVSPMKFPTKIKYFNISVATLAGDPSLALRLHGGDDRGRDAWTHRVLATVRQ